MGRYVGQKLVFIGMSLIWIVNKLEQQNQLMNELRQTMMSQAQAFNTKSRFGLFSQPPPLALGDSYMYSSKTARKGEDGKPITQPRNMLAGPNKSGVTKKDFLQAPSSINVGDQYLDPEKVSNLYNKKMHTRASFHELEFKPSSGRKTLASTSYKYVEQKLKEKAKPARDETGRVITKDKNVTSNPMTRVESDLFKPLKHYVDPYERKDMLEKQARTLAKQKMGQDVYRSMSHGNILFSSNKEAYGCDSTAEELLKQKKQFKNSQPRKVTHQAPFKLTRRGHGDPLGKYPQFIAPINTQRTTCSLRKQKIERQMWRPNGNKSLSRPTPSISYSAFSIRRHM